MIDLIESPKMRPISSNMAYLNQNDDLKGDMTSDFLCRKWWFRRVCVSNSWTIMCWYITVIAPTSNFPSQHKQRQDRIQRFWLYIPTADALAKFRAKPQVIESSDHLWCLHVSESARQRIMSGSIKSWARCWILDAIDDHLILDCFEGIAKDFEGESHHFSLDQIYNDLDRCFFVWWNLKIGTFIFLVVVRREPIYLSQIQI